MRVGAGSCSGEVETALDGGGIPRAATGRVLAPQVGLRPWSRSTNALVRFSSISHIFREK